MLQYLIFISFFNCFFSHLNFSIAEGTFHLYYPNEYYVSMIFKAIENGTFLFLFSNNATIKEVSGKLSEDLDIQPYHHKDFESKVYAQNFTVGDYFKAIIRTGMDEYLTIKKVDANFRLMPHPNVIFRSYYYDCEKPLYFFTINDKEVLGNNQYYYHIQNHFGEVKAFYKKECFIYNLNLTDDNSFDKIKNDSYALLPICDVNLIKFECEQPSLFTFYAAKKHMFIPYDEISHVNLVYNKISISAYYSLFKINLFYFQSFHLVGNTTYDFTEFGKGKYSAQDFHFEYSYPERFTTSYTVSNGTSEPSLVIDFLNNGVSKEKLSEENVKKLYENRILIQLKPEKTKKYIKIETTTKPFRFCYIFSMTEDLNYLPSFCGFYSLVHENYTYINNPYHYNNKNNNYTWFLFLRSYFGGETQYYTYKYTDQYSEDGTDEPEKEEKNTDEKDEEEGKKERDINGGEKPAEGEMSLAGKVFLGIGIVVMIGIILFLAFFFYRRSKLKNTESSFNVAGKKQLINAY